MRNKFIVENVTYIISEDNGYPCILREDGEIIQNQKSILRKEFRLLGSPISKQDDRTTHELIRELSNKLQKDNISNLSKKDCIQKLNDFISDIDCLIPLYKYSKDANIFNILDAGHYEIRHSNMLAWLLNPNGNHNLGDKFLKKILIHILKKSPLQTFDSLRPIDIEMMDLSDAVVQREYNHIDILIYSETNGLVLTIENKLYSAEHDNQLNRYKDIVKKQFNRFKHFVFVFLSIEGEEATDNEHWINLKYEFIKDVIESMIKTYDITQKVKYYLLDYLAILRRYYMEDKEIKEICSKIYLKHQSALDLIFENKPDFRDEVMKYMLKFIKDRAKEYNYHVMEDSCNKRYIRFLPNEIFEACNKYGKDNNWMGTVLSYEIENPESGPIKLSLVIGPVAKPENYFIREKIFELALENPTLFHVGKKNKLNESWKSIDKYHLYINGVENLAEEYRSGKVDFDDTIGKKIGEFLKNNMQHQTRMLAKVLK